MSASTARSVKERLIRATASLVFQSGAIRVLRRMPERFRFGTKRLGPLSIPWVSRRRSPFVQVLTFHSVNDEDDPFLPATPTTVFNRHMRYLAAHYAVCDAHHLKSMLSGGDVPRRAVVITFDDGYKDVLDNAFPILSELSMPAIVFLPSDHIGTERMLWHDQVARAFRLTERVVMPAYGDPGGQLGIETRAERVAAFRATADFLRTLDNAERARWLERLHDDLEVPPPSDAEDLMMSWDDVRTMHAGGIAFGSHTVTQPILSRLATDEARAELEESKRIIEAELGEPVRLLAYPNGSAADFSEVTKELVEQAGYDGALTTIFGVNCPGQDLFEMRRGGPWEEHLPTFALKLVWYGLTA